MRSSALATLALALALALPAAAQEVEEPVTPGSVVAAASAEEWLAIAPDDLLVMELAPDAEGNARTVVIQLMPPPFSQPWVANLRRLARAHWWDGTSVYRVQDNYVTQWGDMTEEKALPEGVVSPDFAYSVWTLVSPGEDADHSASTIDFLSDFRLDQDPYIPGGSAFFHGGWPLGFAPDTDAPWSPGERWPIHCYGYIGVARDYAPDTGTGAELYTIIGQPQRHMDRNLAVVGRVIEGMEHLSSLPRGHGELGFYAEDEEHLRTPIVSVRLASELPDPPAFEFLDTGSESFPRYVEVRANRNDPFYTQPAGGVDVCSVEVPVRPVEAD